MVSENCAQSWQPVSIEKLTKAIPMQQFLSKPCDWDIKNSQWLSDTGLALPQGQDKGAFLPLTIEELAKTVPNEANLVKA
jgi:hypothetical protein